LILALPVPYFEARGFGQTPLVLSLASAINTEEGANPSNNNPGNLMDVAYYQQTGQYRPMTYPTLAAGQAAEDSLIQSYVNQGLTLQQFFAKWAPAGQGSNNPTVYAEYVASATGLPSDQPLNAVSVDPSSPVDSGFDLSSIGLPDLSLPDLTGDTLISGVPDWFTWGGVALIGGALILSVVKS
jgi:hypothetical protein